MKKNKKVKEEEVEETAEETVEETVGETVGDTVGEEKETVGTIKAYCREHGEVEAILKKGRYFCPICNKLCALSPIEEEESPLTPPELEVIEEAINFLKENLPKVHGITSKNIKPLIQNIRDQPMVLTHPTTLHGHIKSLIPKAYDPHLKVYVIDPLFAKFPNLPEMVTRYLSSTQYNYQMYPYSPPTPTPTPFAPFTPNQPTVTLSPNIHWYNAPTALPFPRYTFQSPTYQLPQQQQPKKTYKVVVDGQEIICEDAESYRAWLDYIDRRKREREEWEQKKREWDLRMQKLEAEIKSIVAKKETEEKKEVRKPTIDERVNRRIEFLEKELSTLRKEKEQLSSKLAEQEKRILDEKIRSLESQLNEYRRLVSNPDALINQYVSLAQKLGYSRTGKSVLDVIETTAQNIDSTIKQLIQKLPAPTPKQRKIYTEEERREKIKKIKEGLKKSEELLKAEDELIQAARKYYMS